MIDRLVRAMETARQRERGAALVTVLLFMVIVLILITSVLAVTGNEIRISGLHSSSVRALELAQAGIQEGVRRIQSGRTFFPTTECVSGTDGFPPSVPLSAGETLQVRVCQISSGSGVSVYEVQSDAKVGVAVRKLSVTVRVFVNNIPPEIILSRDFQQKGSSEVEEGDTYAETFSQFTTLPGSGQRAFAGWFIQDLSASGDPKCYVWPCTSGLNLYPGHRRLLDVGDDDLAGLPDANDDSCPAPTTEVTGVRADDPTQTAQTFKQYGYDTDPEMVTYVLRSENEPLVGVPTAEFNKLLLEGVGTSGSVRFAVSSASSKTGYAFTDVLIPGADGRSIGYYAVIVYITEGHSSVSLSVKAARVNAAGFVQNESAATPSQPATVGTMIFAVNAAALGQWGIGDRLRIEYAFTKTGGGSQFVTLETGTTNERVIVPFGDEKAVDPDERPCGLPYKYVLRDVVDETGATVPRYFKTLRTEDWFGTYYEFVDAGADTGWNKTQTFKDNPQFAAIPTFPSDAFIQALINQTPSSNTMAGGGTITGGSSINFGCPPEGSPDPHTPGCNGDDGDYRFVALLDGNYKVTSNINGYGTLIVMGNLDVEGTLTYMGTIYVKGELTLGAGNVYITGGLVTEKTTVLKGNLAINTGEDSGNITVSNEVTVTIGAMWER